MNIIEKIKALLQEAELYRSQSLLQEAQLRYENAADLIRKNEALKGREKTLKGIESKILLLKAEMLKIKEADQAPELSPEVHEIIKKKFSFVTDVDESAFEGAVALAKFGQYKAALKEFNRLIGKERNRMAAAKNIIRCHISLKAFDDVVKQYAGWVGMDLFSFDQLQNLRTFISGILSQKGIKISIPEPGASIKGASEIGSTDGQISAVQSTKPVSVDIPGIEIPGIELPSTNGHDLTEEDLGDVNAIGMTVKEGFYSGKLIEYEISFHSGTELTIIVPEKQKDLAKILKPGYKLKNVQFYTPFAMLAGDCVVESNVRIGTGPKRGDFSLDLRVITS